MGTQQRPYAKWYDEKNAELVSQRDIPGVNSQTITRLWRCSLPEDESQAVLAEMDLYTAAKNTDPQRWVKDPSVGKTGDKDKKTQALGIWRLQYNAYNPPDRPPLGIYQVLSKGYLVAPGVNVAQTTDDDNDSDVANLTDDEKNELWLPIDSQARVLKYDEFLTDQAKNVMGIVNYYVVIFPNVAQERVTEFLDAIEKRPDLSLEDDIKQPRFYSGVLPNGTYHFTKATNKPDEDGSSSDVIAILCNTAAPVNQEILMMQNWQQYDYRRFFSGSVSIPANVLPTNVLAVDDVACVTFPPTTDAPQNTQSTKATIYKITGFNFDREDGLFKMEVTSQVAQPWFVVWDTPTGGTDVEWYVEFYHQTPTWVQGVLDTFDALGMRVTLRPSLDEWKTVSGRIWGNTKSGGNSSDADYFVEYQHESTIRSAGERHELYYVETETWYDERRTSGVAAQKAAFVNASQQTGPGGFFHELGGDRCKWRRVAFVYERYSPAFAKIDAAKKAGATQTLDWGGWILLYNGNIVGWTTKH
jgi:hypothetical protein